MGMFDRIKSASTGVERNDRPKLGKNIVLLEEAKFVAGTNNRSKKDFFKAKCKVIKGEDQFGSTEASADYSGNRMGDVVDYFYMENPQYPDYFTTDIVRFGLACLGITERDLISEEEKAGGADGVTLEDFKSTFIPAILGVDGDGNDVAEGGMFNGIICLEFKTYFKAHGKGDTDASGNLKGLELSIPVRKVPMAEVAEYLDDAGLTRIFGSAQKYVDLVKADEDLQA